MTKGPVIVRHCEVPLGNLPPEAAGLRIAQISDLHLRGLGRTPRHAQELLLGLNYDFLVCTGDLGDVAAKYRTTAELCRRFFAPLAERSPCYVVLGNHDDERLADQPGIPVEFLRDRHAIIGSGASAITLAGVNQALGHNGDIDRALRGAPLDRPAVLLTHYPSTVRRVRDGRVRLVLSGHTHGGQVRLPLIGCVWTHDDIPVRVARGLHQINGIPFHVSAGLGMSWIFRARFLCPPEVTILTLRSVGAELALPEEKMPVSEAAVAA